MNKKKLGFIGLGIMGKPMAINLIKAGYELVVCDLNQEAVKQVVAAGAVQADNPKQVAMQCDITITMLPNSPHVKTVVLGENGFLEGTSEGKLMIDMSSIDPCVSKEVNEVLAKKGCSLLDAPVSGGEPKAIDGSLAIMVGGDEKIFEEVKDILLCMGGSAVLVGDVGSGNVTKIANQIIVALNIAAMSEAMTLATKSGVDPNKVFDAICGGLAGSTVLNAKMPMILERNFNPGFRIELHIKDLLNACSAAQDTGTAIPLTRQVLDIMNTLKTHGKEKLDHCAVIQYYEQLTNVLVQ